MGSCSSNGANNGNGDSGFNPGNNGNGNSGFNPGNGESHRPHSRQAGNMAPNPEQPHAAANANPAADAMNGLVSPQMGAMASPEQPPQADAPAPQAAAPQAEPQGAGQGRPWIDFDPRTGKPMLGNGQVGFQEMSGNNIPINNAEANREAFEAAAGSAFMANNGPQPMEQHMPPQAEMPYGDPLIIGAVSADVSDGRIVSEGHWEEFEAANNVMSIEDYHASL